VRPDDASSKVYAARIEVERQLAEQFKAREAAEIEARTAAN